MQKMDKEKILTASRLILKFLLLLAPPIWSALRSFGNFEREFLRLRLQADVSCFLLVSDSKDCRFIFPHMVKCDISSFAELDIPFPEWFRRISHCLSGVWLLLKQLKTGKNSFLCPLRRCWIFRDEGNLSVFAGQ
jgi:hypothetical protein